MIDNVISSSVNTIVPSNTIPSLYVQVLFAL